MEFNELNLFDFSNDAFSLYSFSIEKEFNTRYVKPPKNIDFKDEAANYDYAIKLAKDIDLKKGVRYFVRVNGSFIFGDFIEALITERNYKVKLLNIETLSLSENNVDSLANLINGNYVEKLNLIVSDYFFSHERSNLIPYIYKELDKNNIFQLAATRTHCKICIFETDNGGKVVIHGSANLRTSGNIEQITIEENEFIYDFNKKEHDKIIKTYKTINNGFRE